jgi:NADH-ubiquinone oxidoreductase chain 5
MFILLTINLLFSAMFSGLFGNLIGKNGVKLYSIFCLLLNIFIIFIHFFFELSTTSTINLGNWISSGFLTVTWTFALDDLTLAMLLVVNFISLLVHIFSISYMAQDPHFIRFMSYISLFTFFMNILVTGDNFIILFLGWEGVGLCSFLLISFWFTRIQANKSSLKAIIVNRISDFILTFGIVLIFYYTLSLDFSTNFAILSFFKQVNIFLFNDIFYFHALTVIAICLYGGAVGKSAQILLHTWLPDAMEGPTPVSALIHAATMVTAGVFLLIKSSWLLELSPKTLLFIGFSGALTSLFAASSGLLLSDIKKIIAYSTCSQLGYMVFICGLSNYSVSLFHLVNHAIFKALLFLCAGAIIHSLSNEQDIRRMGGLLKLLPLSYSTFLIASLAITGFPFLTGFFSKDIILETALGLFGVNNLFVSWLGVLTAFLTAVYSLRILFSVFYLSPNMFRITIKHLHESPFFIGVPLIILAIGSIFFGFFAKDLFIGSGTLFLASNIFIDLYHNVIIDTEYIPTFVKLLPFFFTCSGFLLYTLIHFYSYFFLYYYIFFYNYIYFFLSNKWHFDKLYNVFFIRNIFVFSKKNIYHFIDKGFLEVFGPFGSYNTLRFWKIGYSYFQTGNVSDYILISVIVIFVAVYITF